MEIQRYRLRDKMLGIPFGTSKKSNRGDFFWFFQEGKIGIEQNFTSEAQMFMDAFLGADDSLIIIRGKKKTIIERKYDHNATLGSLPEVKKLADMLLSGSVIYSFLSSENERGTYPQIITFSMGQPPEKFYHKGNPMPITVRDVDYI